MPTRKVFNEKFYAYIKLSFIDNLVISTRETLLDVLLVQCLIEKKQKPMGNKWVICLEKTGIN